MYQLYIMPLMSSSSAKEFTHALSSPAGRGARRRSAQAPDDPIIAVEVAFVELETSSTQLVGLAFVSSARCIGSTGTLMELGFIFTSIAGLEVMLVVCMPLLGGVRDSLEVEPSVMGVLGSIVMVT